ncbi:transcriptional regulator [Paenibacillus sp. BIHB 4019]|uniref:Transcriptional regulator n=1 Tax=Paenibacillus sp. BIHB 4019 TaxID=1870819 RepID=A0A1B2DBR1_9BACL|nr:winged helix-turn-helix domain-containing protein [Paenibacillus sp. BIHB 4019]ANY65149.1 transcriptional regulator [Paenibacillus sp. BIHB 4019]
MDNQQRLKHLAKEFSACQNALSAIGDETRQSIIIAILESANEQGGVRVGEITKKTNLSRPAVSHHIKVLKDAHIIGVTRVGTMNYYYLEPTKSVVFKLKNLFANIETIMNDYWDHTLSHKKEE